MSFKGTGFYVNDSKSSDHKKASKPKSDEKVSAEASAETGAEAGKDVSQFGDHLIVEGIAHLRPVQGNGGDSGLHVQQQVLHGASFQTT